MKYFVFAFWALFLVSFWSCTGENQQDSGKEDVICTVQEVDSVIEVTGVAVDGAMNSVYLKIGDDTVEFSYPDLEGENRASWAINDTLTVRYYETAYGDSVIAIVNETDA